MALRVIDTLLPSMEDGPHGEWNFPTRPIFLESVAYRALQEEIGRYLRMEVNGRSFLISGHRGAGKTSTVIRAIEDIARREILRAIADAAQSGDSLLPPVLQRPLLVKLHGPSLASATLPGPDGSAQQAEDVSHAALVHLTIALYRALARELATCFTNHARFSSDIQQGANPQSADGNTLEMAAQLSMDLDEGAEPAMLREYWRRLGRLDTGVLWPGTVGAALVAGFYRDRGMREIAAVVTAGQAFQVCSGRVEYTRTRKDAAARDASVTVSGKLDGNDALNKLWGLATGGAVAVLLKNNPGVAAVAGLATAFGGALALGWSGQRNQHSDRGTDYRFVVDKSPGTLDRELQVTISRIREAGLAPVFVVDELDKLDDGGTLIPSILNQLKNLTTDYGCFCFLTDRDYFDSVGRMVRGGIYPKEASYFSNRLLIAPHPVAVGLHVFQRIDPGFPPQTNDIAARWVLSCVIPYRAKCNMLDVVRELTGQGVLPDSAQVALRERFLWPMMIQLAMEYILRKPVMRERSENEPEFLQLALDVLYMIARAWDDGKSSVELGRSQVRACLMQRLRVSASSPFRRDEEFAEMVRDTDLVLLCEQVADLALMLSDFELIHKAYRSDVELPNSVSPADIFVRDRYQALSGQFSTMPGGPGFGLTRPDVTNPALWHFTRLPDGREPEPALAASAEPAGQTEAGLLEGLPGEPDVGPEPPPGAGGRVEPEAPSVGVQIATGVLTGAAKADIDRLLLASGVLTGAAKADIDRLLGHYSAFTEALRAHGVRFVDLVDFGVLPSHFSAEAIAKVAGLLGDARGIGHGYPELWSDLLVLRGIVDFLARRRPVIVTAVALSKKIVADAETRFGKGTATTRRALRAIECLLGLPEMVDRPPQEGPALGPGPVLETLPTKSSSRAGFLGLGRHALDADFSIQPLFLSIFAPWRGRPFPEGWIPAIEDEIHRLYPLLGHEGDPVAECWEIWRTRLAPPITRTASPEPVPLAYSELVLHAADQMPSGPLDSSHPSRLTVAGLSRFCMLTDAPDFQGPTWARMAGLFRLGFGVDALSLARFVPSDTQSGEFADGLAALGKVPGIVVPYDDPTVGIAASVPTAAIAVFAVPFDQIDDYRSILTRMAEAGMLTAVGGEIGTDT